jgi:ectoine hydroxylase-related dioxygenase (phytanoyl-CoA dioxygenase family)
MTDTRTFPALDDVFTLTPQQIADYRENGHVFLPAVCTPQEVAEFEPVITSASQRLNPPTRPLEERDTFGKAFTLAAGLWNRDEAVARFTLAKRFARIAAELMGVEGVRLYHDVSINKEAGGGYTPWHQDAYYWPMDTPHTITMWMPLVDITHEMGGLNFASGSQHDGYLGEGISDDSQAFYDEVIARRGFPVVSHAKQRGVLKAGDATFHNGWTLHSAPPNNSDRARQVMTVVYYADGVRTFADMGNPHREYDFKAFMPGVVPGELAASPMNPVLYP